MTIIKHSDIYDSFNIIVSMAYAHFRAHYKPSMRENYFGENGFSQPAAYRNVRNLTNPRIFVKTQGKRQRARERMI